MATVTAQQQKWLLKKFHTLCARLNMDADMKLALISGYGVESSKDLTNAELLELCDHLNEILNPEDAKTDKMRKRVIAAIGRLAAHDRQRRRGDKLHKRAWRVKRQRPTISTKSLLERLTTIYNMFCANRRCKSGERRWFGKIA